MYSYTALKKYPLTGTELLQVRQIIKRVKYVRVLPIVNDVTALRYRQGASHLAEALLRYNAPLILDIIYRFDRRGCEIDDLFQGGFLGLLKATRLYDGHVRFTTLAPWYIFQGIQIECNQTRRVARILEPQTDRHLQYLYSRIKSFYTVAEPLDQLLEGLTPDQRIAVQLWAEGWSLRELGTALGVSYQAIAGRVHRALVTLRKQVCD